MAYAFKQDHVDSLIDDDGSFTVGTLFDRAWFQVLISDLNQGFRKAKTDSQPAVDIDAAKQGILAGLGGGSAPDTGFFRSASLEWRARNAADSAFAKVSGADPTDPQNFVTLQYGDSNYIQTIPTVDPLTLTTLAPPLPAVGTLYKDTIPGAWCNINGIGVVSILGQVNVVSVTDLGVGEYRINFNRLFETDAKTAFSVMAVNNNGYIAFLLSDNNAFFEVRVLTQGGSPVDSNVQAIAMGPN